MKGLDPRRTSALVRSNSRTHFKMYKAGRKWLVAGISAISGLFGFGAVGVAPARAATTRNGIAMEVGAKDVAATQDKVSIPATSEMTGSTSASARQITQKSASVQTGSTTQIQSQGTTSAGDETSVSTVQSNRSTSTATQQTSTGQSTGSTSVAESSTSTADSATSSSTVEQSVKQQRASSTTTTQVTAVSEASASEMSVSDVSLSVTANKTVESSPTSTTPLTTSQPLVMRAMAVAEDVSLTDTEIAQISQQTSLADLTTSVAQRQQSVA